MAAQKRIRWICFWAAFFCVHFLFRGGGARCERFSVVEIRVLKLANRPSDGVNRNEFLHILLRKIAHGVGVGILRREIWWIPWSEFERHAFCLDRAKQFFSDPN
jgi:hypothetical protein